METTLLSKIIFIVTVTLPFKLMTPKLIRFFPFHRGIMWSRLVKIRLTELKLLCGNLCGRPPASTPSPSPLSPAHRTQTHNTDRDPSQDERIAIYNVSNEACQCRTTDYWGQYPRDIIVHQKGYR